MHIRAGLTAPMVTAVPSYQTIVIGQSATFTAAASGNPAPSYRWQVSTDGGASWSEVPNAAPYSGIFTTTLRRITAAPARSTGRGIGWW